MCLQIKKIDTFTLRVQGSKQKKKKKIFANDVVRNESNRGVEQQNVQIKSQANSRKTRMGQNSVFPLFVFSFFSATNFKKNVSIFTFFFLFFFSLVSSN